MIYLSVAFLSWLDNLDLVPTIVSLRERAEQIRLRELEKAIEAMSRAIVNKILHDPVSTLKNVEEKGDAPGLVDAVQRLFSLGSKKG